MKKETSESFKELYEYINRQYRYFYTNPPLGIKRLTKMELLTLGIINEDIYMNPVSAAMVLNENHLINEAEYSTFPINKTIEYVCGCLNLKKHMFSIGNCHNDTQIIIVRTPNKKGLKEEIDAAMHLCGYYLSNKNYLQGDKRFLELKYEPKYIEEASVIVRDSKILYHLSPLPYKGKILKKGFVPKSGSKVFNYPDRTYFFLGTMGKPKVLSWLPVFKKYNSKYQNTPYCLYTVDVSKIPFDTTFYLDPNLKGGCYTPDNISPYAIMSVEEISD